MASLICALSKDMVSGEVGCMGTIMRMLEFGL